MLVDSPKLEAFQAIAKAGTISAAAHVLHLTQPAISARLAALESELGAQLLVRHRLGVELTEPGRRLLRYCKTRESLEQEVLAGLVQPDAELRGSVVVAAYTSLCRPLVVPILADALREHPHVHIDLRVETLDKIPPLLVGGEADFALLDYPLSRAGIEHGQVGTERYVLIAARHHPDSDTYWDVNANDNITLAFFQHQGQPLPTKFQRNYAGNMEALIDIVAHGLGRAVVPRHLANTQRDRVRIVRGYTPLDVPVYLHARSARFRTQLQERVATALADGLRRSLRA